MAHRDLLKCPVCGEVGTIAVDLLQPQCHSCGAFFAYTKGILDFVAGRDTTALDVAAYDLEKEVSLQRSQELFNHLKRVAGDILPTELGDVLEVGAGTGLLTVGMLEGSAYKRAVVTDVSPKMLSLCRERVRQCLDLTDVLFATYSGKEDVFADVAYDLCIANSVLHHILDYRSFFVKVRRILKPNARAIFVEPSGAFHAAMTTAMSDALLFLLAQGFPVASRDMITLSKWIVERRAGFLFPEETRPEVEDKHVFFRSELEQAARDAGFSRSIILPWDRDELGNGVLGNYAAGLGLTPEFREIFNPEYRRFAAAHFRDIAPKDMSSMYLIGLLN